ncbi:MAG: hypothetical protein BWX50_01352 [Euryarchaeota archaeon ADurb.Bin009]|nr:MAG: hypothetical protein BWX50_01352 [Euryarchaeota archaeon ADurb.Bin009]
MHDVVADLGFVARFDADAFDPRDPQGQGLFVFGGFVTVDRQVEDPGLDEDDVLAHPGPVASANVDTLCRRHGQLACVGEGERVQNVVPENLGFRGLDGYDAGGLRTDFSVGFADAGGLYLDLVIEDLPLLGLGDHDAYRQDDPGPGDNLDRVALDEREVSDPEDTDRPGCVESLSDDRDVVLQDLQVLRVAAGPDTPGLDGRVVEIQSVLGAVTHGDDPVALNENRGTLFDDDPGRRLLCDGRPGSDERFIILREEGGNDRVRFHLDGFETLVPRDRHDVVVVDVGFGDAIDHDACLSAAPDDTHRVVADADSLAALDEDTAGEFVGVVLDRDRVVLDGDRPGVVGVDPE